MIIENAVILVMAILLPLVPAFVLYRVLPSDANVEGPWHGLKIKLTGAFGGYFLLVVTLLAYMKTMPNYQVWTVHGNLDFADGERTVNEAALRVAVKPAVLNVNPDGRFWLVVHRGPDPSGDVSLPTLLVDYPNYRTLGVDLEERGEKSTFTRRVVLSEPLVLEPVPVENVHRDP